MNKRHFSRCRYILIKIIIFILLFLLLFKLLGYIENLHTDIDILVKKNYQQQKKIETLASEKAELEMERRRLERLLIYQSSIVAELKSKPIITEQPIIEEKPSHKKERSRMDELFNSNIVITTIVTTLVSVGYTIKSLIPTIP